jgi:Domain of unknown function (DUF4157)
LFSPRQHTHDNGIQQKTSSSGGKQAATNTRSGKIFFQGKLTVNDPNDHYEKEADAMADTVMRKAMQPEPFFKPSIHKPNSTVHRKCADCEQEEVQRKPLTETITPIVQRSAQTPGFEVSSSVQSAIHSSKGNGSKLPIQLREEMESGLGADFSSVHIHTGDTAVQLSRDLNAKAFTTGSDIYFNSGEYAPGTDSGKHLLAHELTHVVQQGAAGNGMVQRTAANHCTTRTTGIAGSDAMIEQARTDALAAMQRTIEQLDRYLADSPDGWFREVLRHTLNVYFNCPSDDMVRLIRGNIASAMPLVRSRAVSCTNDRTRDGLSAVRSNISGEFIFTRSFFQISDPHWRMQNLLTTLFDDFLAIEVMLSDLDTGMLDEHPPGSPLRNLQPTESDPSFFDYENRPSAQYVFNHNPYASLVLFTGSTGFTYEDEVEEHTAPCETASPSVTERTEPTQERTPIPRDLTIGATLAQTVYLFRDGAGRLASWSYTVSGTDSLGTFIIQNSYHLPGTPRNFIVFDGQRYFLNEDHSLATE